MIFSGYSSFLHQKNQQPQYNWNIIESGIKHYNRNPYPRSYNPSNYQHHIYKIHLTTENTRGRRGRDRMVVWFTTIYAISAYHH